ncbi:hypothetical protein CHH28_13860 [Bacterioplanes sanyensis]|uniref:Uncharacterized protein n=1 Tax=Bacterioplanes sanyensis TaxID=1249553 RepID=A0A222FLZ8_9GAMM|nr:hypothetical protein [Bacterioplanes sanyensis]ASP39692.1 hypothetical protein CHH28_13860 [Bacterioplanes sanyensis]
MQRMLLPLLTGITLNVASSVYAHADAVREMSQPIPLYANPELALSVRRSEHTEWQLLLCASGERTMRKNYPLVLSVDGQFVRLPALAQAPSEREGYWCHAFATSAEQLQSMTTARQVLVRAFFDSGKVDARVSGTEADYLTRPQALGPLAQIQDFVSDQASAVEVIVDGG